MTTCETSGGGGGDGGGGDAAHLLGVTCMDMNMIGECNGCLLRCSSFHWYFPHLILKLLLSTN